MNTPAMVVAPHHSDTSTTEPCLAAPRLTPVVGIPGVVAVFAAAPFVAAFTIHAASVLEH